MRESTNRNSIHSGFCDGSNRFQLNSPAGLQQQAGWPRLHGPAHGREVHVVEQEDIDSGNGIKREHLLQSIRLDLNPEVRTALFEKANPISQGRVRQPACKVVVFNHDHIVEADAVIRSSTGDHGSLLQQAKTGRRFPGVQNSAAGSGDGINVTPGDGRDCAQPLKEIESGALGREQRTEATGDLHETIPRFTHRSIGLHDLDHERGVNPPKNFGSGFNTGRNASDPGDNPADPDPLWLAKCLNRYVAGSDILGKR